MSPSAPPLVTIGIPTYNREKFLPRAIEAVLGQTYMDLEVIIGDDASTDGTREIAEAAVTRDARVRYLRQEKNTGSPGNFRAMLEAAGGKYFMWHCDDDVAAPTYVERTVAFLEDHPDVVTCGTDYEFVDEEMKVLGDWLMDGLREDSSWERARRAFFRYGDGRYVMMIYSMHRTEVLRRVGVPAPVSFVRSMMGVETPFLARLATQGRMVALPERLFYYNEHPNARESLAHVANARLKRWQRPVIFGAIQSRLAATALTARIPWRERAGLLGECMRGASRHLTRRRGALP